MFCRLPITLNSPIGTITVRKPSHSVDGRLKTLATSLPANTGGRKPVLLHAAWSFSSDIDTPVHSDGRLHAQSDPVATASNPAGSPNGNPTRENRETNRIANGIIATSGF